MDLHTGRTVLALYLCCCCTGPPVIVYFNHRPPIWRPAVQFSARVMIYILSSRPARKRARERRGSVAIVPARTTDENVDSDRLTATFWCAGVRLIGAIIARVLSVRGWRYFETIMQMLAQING